MVHDDVIKWKHFPRYWPVVRGIHRSPVNSPHKGQWRGASMFSLICTWKNRWVNNREAGDLRRYRAHYDVIVIKYVPNKIVRVPSANKADLQVVINTLRPRRNVHFCRRHFQKTFSWITHIHSDRLLWMARKQASRPLQNMRKIWRVFGNLRFGTWRRKIPL